MSPPPPPSTASPASGFSLFLSRLQEAFRIGKANNNESNNNNNRSIKMSSATAAAAAGGEIRLPSSKVCLDMTSSSSSASSNGGLTAAASHKRREKAPSGDSKSSSASSSSGNTNSASATGGEQTSAAASKLSKFGKRLRESCRSLKPNSASKANKQTPEDFATEQAPNDSNRSKHYVAMDFTGSEGEIIQSHQPPTSGRCYASKDGYAYFRRKVSPKEVEPLLTETQSTVHTRMPWFHRGISRELAQRILAAHNVDGTFLVRESSVSGGFVISYVHSGRTFHAQVLPDRLERDPGPDPADPDEPGFTAFYSLDEGRTRFFDLLQMVEFYQLNRGSLQTRLRHYIVRAKIQQQAESTPAAGEKQKPAAVAPLLNGGGAEEQQQQQQQQERAESPKSRSGSTASEASMESQTSQHLQQQQQQQTPTRQQQPQTTTLLGASASASASDAPMPSDSDDSESMEREFHQQG